MENPLHRDLERMNEIRAQARAEAEALRRAAMDDFWRGANAALATAAGSALRSARRLAHRLQRRRALANGQA
jgi:hypothetical protein